MNNKKLKNYFLSENRNHYVEFISGILIILLLISCVSDIEYNIPYRIAEVIKKLKN